MVKSPTAYILFIAIGLVAACNYTPFPGLRENMDGLEQSPIGNYLAENAHWNRDKDTLTDNIKYFFLNNYTNYSPEQRAEMLGMKCNTGPDNSCSYYGTLKYHLTGLPEGSPHKGKETVVAISIFLPSYNDLTNIKVEKSETEIPVK